MTKGEEDLREVESGVLESVLRPYFEHKKKLSHKCVISSFKWMPFEWGPQIENKRSTNMTRESNYSVCGSPIPLRKRNKIINTTSYGLERKSCYGYQLLCVGTWNPFYYSMAYAPLLYFFQLSIFSLKSEHHCAPWILKRLSRKVLLH